MKRSQPTRARSSLVELRIGETDLTRQLYTDAVKARRNGVLGV
ncbi:hypothetical protein [Streptomyces yangpuensis]